MNHRRASGTNAYFRGVENVLSVQELVLRFVAETNYPLFLTGKAGTGKTTFLHQLKTTTSKNYVVVAPTAVAAINAGGSTIHSFFQMQPGPLMPAADGLLSLRLSAEKTAILLKLELLIIDEISMVRADTLDHIDAILRQVRGIGVPFGGVQVLMIGDLYQLPPVWEKDWPILSKYYTGPYFFNSLVLTRTEPLCFELTKVYRQSDENFISILNHIREGNVAEGLLAPLNKHFDPAVKSDALQDFVTLTTHVQSVNELNQQKLDELPSDAISYRAEVNGEFPEDAFPAKAELVLKEGALVMFIKNDSSGKKQYYNGRTARITALSPTSIRVVFVDDGSEFEVLKETWQNVRFALAANEQKIDETNAGTFVQYPLRLAWAITIHKSQGLTFEKVVIDVASAFAAGQTYVALSRCRSLDGIVLRSPIRPENVKTDERIRAFMQKTAVRIPDINLLALAQENGYHDLIRDVFSFQSVQRAWGRFAQHFSGSLAEHMNQPGVAEIAAMIGKELLSHGERFGTKEIGPRRTYPTLIEKTLDKNRIKAALNYFQPRLQALQQFLHGFFQRVGQHEMEPEFYENYNLLQLIIQVKLAMMQAAAILNSTVELLVKGQEAAIQYRPVFKNWKPVALANEPEIVNPELYQKMVAWRRLVAEKKNVPEYSLLSEKSLREIAKKTPKTLGRLAQINNFGEARAKEYGADILAIVNGHFGQGNTLF